MSIPAHVDLESRPYGYDPEPSGARDPARAAPAAEGFPRRTPAGGAGVARTPAERSDRLRRRRLRPLRGRLPAGRAGLRRAPPAPGGARGRHPDVPQECAREPRPCGEPEARGAHVAPQRQPGRRLRLREHLRDARHRRRPPARPRPDRGGPGLHKTTSMLVSERGALCASFSVSWGAHTGIGTLPIVYYGTEAQKTRYLPKLATGEWLAAYALTEPQAGSDALAISTRGTFDPANGAYRLSGTKQFITNAGFADVFTVFAKVDG